MIDSNKAVFVHYDIFGWTGGRIRSIADQISHSGYHVFMLNFFRNDDGIASYGGFGQFGPSAEGMAHTVTKV